MHAWRVLGQGSEHVAWQVETASGPWVLRVRWGAAIDERAERIRLTREAAVMARVRRLALPVAEAIVLEGEPDRDPRADDEHHPDRDHDRDRDRDRDHDRGGANGAGGGGGVALAYRRLPGRPLQDLLAEGAVLSEAVIAAVRAASAYVAGNRPGAGTDARAPEPAAGVHPDAAQRAGGHGLLPVLLGSARVARCI